MGATGSAQLLLSIMCVIRHLGDTAPVFRQDGLPDSSFFAPDCFHFSSKAHAHAASALWNNMLEPVGQKTTQHKFESKINIMCPNQDWPYLSTYKNDVQDYGSRLLCSDRAPSASPPTSVHALRPADIQVVAALGDSLTAGNGIGSKADDLSDVTTQYRGLSFRKSKPGFLSGSWVNQSNMKCTRKAPNP